MDGDGDWMRQMEDFGIEQHGGFGIRELSQSVPPRQRSKPSSERVIVRVNGDVTRHRSRLDFIQAIACADEEELNTLMHIVINVMVRECHKERVVGGDVEKALEVLTEKWKDFCTKCVQLKDWIRQKREEEQKKMENKEEEEMKERARKRRRTRALLSGDSSKSVTSSDSVQNDGKRTTDAKEREYQELLRIFGSDLLIDIGRTPEEVYQDTKNVRIGTILCMLSKSKALQRLACVGKFYAVSLGHEYRYVKIPKESLDEFLAVTNILRNAFMTQQTSPGLFVRVVQNLVIRGGVHGYIQDVLNVARKQETIRLSLSSTL